MLLLRSSGKFMSQHDETRIRASFEFSIYPVGRNIATIPATTTWKYISFHFFLIWPSITGALQKTSCHSFAASLHPQQLWSEALITRFEENHFGCVAFASPWEMHSHTWSLNFNGEAGSWRKIWDFLQEFGKDRHVIQGNQCYGDSVIHEIGSRKSKVNRTVAKVRAMGERLPLIREVSS